MAPSLLLVIGGTILYHFVSSHVLASSPLYQILQRVAYLRDLSAHATRCHP
jgi:hypothetical protein